MERNIISHNHETKKFRETQAEIFTDIPWNSAMLPFTIFRSQRTRQHITRRSKSVYM